MNLISNTKSELLTKEDYWSIWIGVFLLLIGLGIFYFYPFQKISQETKSLKEFIATEEEQFPFKTVNWYDANDRLNKLSSGNTEVGQLVNQTLMHPKKWVYNPMSSFYKSTATAEAQTEVNELSLMEDKMNLDYYKSEALYRLDLAANKFSFEDTTVNNATKEMIALWHDSNVAYVKNYQKAQVEPYNLFLSLAILGIALAIIFSFGAHFMGIGAKKFVVGFILVFILAVVSQVLGNQADMKNLGFGYAIWAIVIGLLISNTIGTPKWVKPAVQTEYYIKTGLVLLGAEILFSKILAIGLPGIFVAWVVTPIVLISTFWFGQKVLKIASKSLNITISADMSVCGVSAAIATAAACKAKKEELTLAVGMSMVFTAIMMIALPTFIKTIGMPEVLGGAWIGGTIDATGAVVAAGAFLGERALNVAATIKMIQNMLIGLIAFGVAVYWASKVEKTSETSVGAGEIWKRFPKFILGFVGASIVFSILFSSSGADLGDALIDKGVIRSFTKDLRGWFFSLAFVSIGLSVNFKELKKYFKGGKPLVLYLLGQTFNLLLTLLMAYLMFYVIFPEITEKI